MSLEERLAQARDRALTRYLFGEITGSERKRPMRLDSQFVGTGARHGWRERQRWLLVLVLIVLWTIA
jgi:hypothetical protein